MTTHFEWAPDGRHFITATTAPRLRTSNGFRIWNYGKGIVYHQPLEKDELWQVYFYYIFIAFKLFTFFSFNYFL